jgi:hypothetical protein
LVPFSVGGKLRRPELLHSGLSSTATPVLPLVSFRFRVHLGVACEEWKKLLKRYSALVTAYSEAVNESLPLSGEKFEKARAHFDQLRILGQNARIAMEEHERAHGCNPASQKADS